MMMGYSFPKFASHFCMYEGSAKRFGSSTSVEKTETLPPLPANTGVEYQVQITVVVLGVGTHMIHDSMTCSLELHYLPEK